MLLACQALNGFKVVECVIKGLNAMRVIIYSALIVAVKTKTAKIDPKKTCQRKIL